MQLTVKKMEACDDGKVRAELAGAGVYVKLVADDPKVAAALKVGGTITLAAKE